jgi:hypothetical protein
MSFETMDAVAILGYAGLGITAKGAEPSDWMRAVLRGVNLPFERSMHHLAQVMGREIPSHLAAVGSAHNVVIPVFLNDELRLYRIDLVLRRGDGGCDFRFVRQILAGGRRRDPRIVVAGSGAGYLFAHKNRLRDRLLKIIKAYERGRVSESTVADNLAALNLEVSSNINSVGPNCDVVWRYRRNGRRGGGGSARHYVKGIWANNPSPRSVLAAGHDVTALAGVMMCMMEPVAESLATGQPVKLPGEDELRLAFGQLPESPDETLR